MGKCYKLVEVDNRGGQEKETFIGRSYGIAYKGFTEESIYSFQFPKNHYDRTFQLSSNGEFISHPNDGFLVSKTVLGCFDAIPGDRECDIIDWTPKGGLAIIEVEPQDVSIVNNSTNLGFASAIKVVRRVSHDEILKLIIEEGKKEITGYGDFIIRYFFKNESPTYDELEMISRLPNYQNCYYTKPFSRRIGR